MPPGNRRTGTTPSRWITGSSRKVRLLVSALVFLFALAHIPLASAHGDTATPGISQWHTLWIILAGLVIGSGTVVLKRLDKLSPTIALYGVLAGLAVTAVGAILFEGLSPDLTYTASSMPFPRSWYAPLSLSLGLFITVVSFIVGWLRWPARPRYMFLGILMGGWIAYPVLIPGPTSASHPLGYAIVIGTPIFVGYIVWKDAGSVLQTVMRDPVARRFGLGVGILVALFFVSVTGYLSFFSEEGGPHEPTIDVLPVTYQLVTWPTLEIVLPHIPFLGAISPGLVIIVGTVSILIGLNAALIARQWRIEEQAGMTESTAGTAAVVGSCTCGCCGPLVAKVAVLAAGPSIAAPLYWLFIDSASPLSSLFIIGSIVLFTGSIVYSVDTVRRPDHSSSVLPAD